MTAGLVADVVVLGAGPAGCAAAITAARAGLSVIVADRARFPRDKSCGDGLTTGALRRLEGLGLRPEEIASFTTVEDLYLRSSSGRTARLGLDRAAGVYAAVAPRRELDAALVGLTRASGATVLEDAAFLALEAEPDRPEADIVVSLENNPQIRARFVIGADGAWSPLRRFLGGGAPAAPGRSSGPDWFAFRAYLHDVSPEASAQMWVWFEKALLPGYAWSFPLGQGRANIGLFLRRDPTRSGRALQEAWQSFLQSPFLASLAGPTARLSQGGRAWPIPTDISRAKLADLSGRALYVGDAARAADPFSGEGIAQAIETGAAAAAAIALHRDPASPLAAQTYQSEIATKLDRDHQIARHLSRLIASDQIVRATVYGLSHSRFLAREAGRWLFEDYPRRAILSPHQIMAATLRLRRSSDAGRDFPGDA